jgi:hypothetical protein
MSVPLVACVRGRLAVGDLRRFRNARNVRLLTGEFPLGLIVRAKLSRHPRIGMIVDFAGKCVLVIVHDGRFPIASVRYAGRPLERWFPQRVCGHTFAMRASPFFGVVLAVAGIVCSGAAVHAQDAVAPPIVVTDCRGGIASVELVEIAAYNVRFRNTAAVAADEIRLSIPYGRRKTATFDVRGTFGPDIVNTRALRKTVGVGLYSWESTQNNCRVDYVHFADGASWSRPSS